MPIAFYRIWSALNDFPVVKLDSYDGVNYNMIWFKIGLVYNANYSRIKVSYMKCSDVPNNEQ